MTKEDGMSEKNNRQIETENQHDSLVLSSINTYLIIGGIGLLLCHYGEGDIASLYPYSLSKDQWIRVGLLGLISASLLLITSALFERQFESFKGLRDSFSNLFGGIAPVQLLFLSVVSGVSEEVFFRGGLQPMLGVPLTALIFGLLHLGPKGLPNSWSVWALLSGFVLGFLADRDGHIWSSTFAHILVNGFSFIMIHRAWKKQQSNQKAKGGIEPSQAEGKSQ
mgnify:FL=1